MILYQNTLRCFSFVCRRRVRRGLWGCGEASGFLVAERIILCILYYIHIYYLISESGGEKWVWLLYLCHCPVGCRVAFLPLAGGRWRRPLHPLLVALARGLWAALALAPASAAALAVVAALAAAGGAGGAAAAAPARAALDWSRGRAAAAFGDGAWRRGVAARRGRRVTRRRAGAKRRAARRRAGRGHLPWAADVSELAILAPIAAPWLAEPRADHALLGLLLRLLVGLLQLLLGLLLLLLRLLQLVGQ